MADSTVQDIKDRLSVADVIGGYIQVKKAGANFKALCPFHNERTPSFHINPARQVWHCFGCGEGGDIFEFVEKFENVDFKEALKILAQKAGVTLPEFRPQDPKIRDEKELLNKINDFAARFYHKILFEDRRAKEALEYLQKRGLAEETLKKWQVGFAPADFHTLEQALQKKKVFPEAAIQAGVLTKNERGQVYDRFRGRITFPIFDSFGQAVGFSARILPSLDDGKAGKYINSPESLIYHKSKILFGLNFAKKSIRKNDEAVLVEGQMDCIAAHQAGFENVVAGSGTALTLEQLNLLSPLSKNLKFCFDSDQAGEAACRKAGELALKQGFRLKVVVLGAAKDPDELIKKSPNLWKKAVSEAVWFLDWQMDFALKLFPKDPVEQKHYLTEHTVPLLAYVSDALEQDHYIRRMSEKFSVSDRTIRELVRQNRGGVVKPENKPKTSLPEGVLALEKQILGGMLLDADFRAMVYKESKIGDFSDSRIAEILAPGFQDKEVLLDASSALAKEAEFMVESMLAESTDREIFFRELKRAFGILLINSFKKQQQKLQSEIRQAEIGKNSESLSKLSRDFEEISRKRIFWEKFLSS